MNITNAILIATKVHDDQTDKGGQPYILHPIRVMMQFGDNTHRIVSILHDVMEDSSIDEDILNNYGFDKDIIEAVNCLTRKKNENYFDYIDRIKTNKIASNVKLADLRDNMNLERIPNLTKKDKKRVEKYEKAYKIINNAL
jgi:(p)ppGpp synthase/HD superfamily hydrolase